ncbi:MAG: monofunctional biosynthetic peptidoglycan transglycosylase [Pseudomonadota bacterium]
MNERMARVLAYMKRLVLWALFVVLVLPVMYLFLLKYINPPITPLMVLRTLQGYQFRHEWVDAPQRMRFAVVASEDNKFCVHQGFDWKALRWVLADAIEGDKSVSGASTISMQTSKNLLLLPTRSVIRKALEAYYTIWLELLLDKPRIMQLYLNVIEYGRGVYGVEAASQYYFSRSAKQLTRRQAAQLAAILPSPLHWSPRRKMRKARVLERRIRQLGQYLRCVR